MVSDTHTAALLVFFQSFFCSSASQNHRRLAPQARNPSICLSQSPTAGGPLSRLSPVDAKG